MKDRWKTTTIDFTFYKIQFLNFFRNKKHRIGFVINGFLLPYSKVMASTRIRVYDVIKMFFDDRDFLVEIYNPFRKKYEIVIFQKKFDRAALLLAKRLKTSDKAKIVFDINVNYYDLSSKYITKQQHEDAIAFTEIADMVIVPSIFLNKQISKLFPDKTVEVIEESINDIFMRKRKINFNLQNPALIWAGYSHKAFELLLIQDILVDLYDEFRFKIILISDKNPKLVIGKIPIYFEKFDYSKFPDQLLKGDIFIAPRNLTDPYNLGHSFTKIGVAMAVGLPVIASPVPSYIGSPAVICEDKKCWKIYLKKMFTDIVFLKKLSIEGRKFVEAHYSTRVVKQKYRDLFKKLLKL